MISRLLHKCFKGIPELRQSCFAAAYVERRPWEVRRASSNSDAASIQNETKELPERGPTQDQHCSQIATQSRLDTPWMLRPFEERSKSPLREPRACPSAPQRRAARDPIAPTAPNRVTRRPHEYLTTHQSTPEQLISMSMEFQTPYKLSIVYIYVSESSSIDF
jgi:hypothetical protein